MIVTNFMYHKIIEIMKNLKFNKKIVIDIDYESFLNYKNQDLKYKTSDCKTNPGLNPCFTNGC